MRSPAHGLAKPPRNNTAGSRFIINVGSNLGYLVLNTLVMLWYIPFLVHHLGVAAYGMISLANSLVTYSAIVSISVDSSINRFLAIDLNQGIDARANQTFNTALALSLGACGILLVPAGIVVYYFPALFNVPAGLGLATQFLFATVGIATLATIISGNFGVVSVITHRFDLRNLVRSLTSLSRVGVVALCFLIWPPSLWHVAAGFIISACIGFIGDVLVWRRLTPQLDIDWHDIDRHRFRELLSLSGWVTVNEFGFLLLTQVNLIIVNAAFGAEMTGRYGALLPLGSLIVTMTGTVSEVVRPAIMARYAAGDIDGLRGLAGRSVKILVAGLALPIGLLCGFGGPLLSLWLGPDFGQLNLLLIVLVSHLTVNLGIMPLLYVITAYNRVKFQGLLTIALGVLNVILAMAFARWSGWGAVGVAAAGAIVWTIRNLVFLSGYSAVIMGLRWWTFYGPLIGGLVGTLGVALVGRLILQLWWPSGWLALGAMAAAISALYGIFAYAFALNHSDRDLLWSLLRRKPYRMTAQ